MVVHSFREILLALSSFSPASVKDKYFMAMDSFLDVQIRIEFRMSFLDIIRIRS